MCLFPDVCVGSVGDIPYEALYDEGYRVVLFDIDNTIVPHGAPADAQAIALFERIRAAGLKAVLISNNREARVKPFAEAVGAAYLHKAGKPKASGFRRAMELSDGTVRNTFFVGDQIFTDVWGARMAGLKTVLTAPIDPKEEIQIVLKRILEKPVLALYRRHVRRYGVTDNPFAETVLYGKRQMFRTARSTCC